MLVEGGAVEAGQAERIFGEVAGDPIDNDADAVLVADVDEVFEVEGTAEAGGRREIAGDLIAPGAAERDTP